MASVVMSGFFIGAAASTAVAHVPDEPHSYADCVDTAVTYQGDSPHNAMWRCDLLVKKVDRQSVDLPLPAFP
ncbi:hypothetical protein ACFY12_29740 [Streptomyces sp. NPDC001339]|uniref:hypothetical protein n=1 Tax=Streptomyces sp. NPDC001339 TaxID=3364563 RepID=UPI00369427EF